MKSISQIISSNFKPGDMRSTSEPDSEPDNSEPIVYPTEQVASQPVGIGTISEIDKQIRFDQKITGKLSRLHFGKIYQAIEWLLDEVVETRQELESHEFLLVTALERLKKVFLKKYVDLDGSRTPISRISLLLSDWIVLSNTLLWDWEDLDLRNALGEIDKIVQNHCHNKILLEKVNLVPFT